MDDVPILPHGTRDEVNNIEACAPSRMTSPQSWIVSPIKTRASTPPVRASAARSAAGRPGRKTTGFAPAGTNGTRSIREESVRRVSISGLRPNASSVADGRRIRTGMRSDLLILALNCSRRDRECDISSESEALLRLQIGNRDHIAARAGTTGYARAFRRAFDSPQRCRLC
jgi:hypothetical protein